MLSPGCVLRIQHPTGTPRSNFTPSIRSGVSHASFGLLMRSASMSWTFSDSGSVSYPRALDCANVTFANGRGSATHTNVATIRETGQSASATVTVTCYELAVSKTAAARFNRAWVWAVDKTGSVASLTLAPNASAPVDYTVVVNATPRDTGFGAAGVITIANPHPTRAAQLTGVSDLVDGSIAPGRFSSRTARRSSATAALTSCMGISAIGCSRASTRR